MGIEGTEKVPVVEPKVEDKPSNPKDAMERFLKVRSDKAAAAKLQDPPLTDDTTGKKADLEPKVEKDPPPVKNPWEGLRIVDAKGNPAKLPISVDGEKIDLDDINKIATSAQFGYHHDKRGKDLTLQEDTLKKRIQEFETESSNFKAGMPFLSKLKTALERGELIMAGDGTLTKPSGEKIDPDHIPISEEDEEHADTQYLDLAKRHNKMIDANKELVKTTDALKKLWIAQLYKDKKTEIDSTIDTLKPKYPHSSEKEIVELLAEINDQNMPKYTIEEAMAISQKSIKGRLDKYVETDPQFMEKTEAQKKKIIQEYLDKVEEKNKPPVSGPQGTGAAGAAFGKKDGDKKSMGPEDHKAAAKKSFEGAAAYLNQKLADGRKA
ncbi:hypothetical protein LCGC14_0831430 [marine sediment metagenome]|uniref:Uncharacterized protein n=1 Tax=marine sediment metagenome TaxID=412755 RepID=A0A0F9PKG1_9ZZZZ|nr:hypothetical protein [bacterium]